MTPQIQNISNNYNNYQAMPKSQDSMASAPMFSMQGQPEADTVQFGQQANAETRKSFLGRHKAELIVGAVSVLPATFVFKNLFAGVLASAGLATILGLTKGKLWGKTED